MHVLATSHCFIIQGEAQIGRHVSVTHNKGLLFALQKRGSIVSSQRTAFTTDLCVLVLYKLQHFSINY